MTEPAKPPEEFRAMMSELIERFGVDGLMERFAAAIDEAAKGQVTGPGIKEATEWLEEVTGDDGVMHGSVTGTVSFEGTATGASTVFKEAFDDAVLLTDEVATALESHPLPDSMEVLIRVQDTFLWLVGAFGLVTDTPPELIPFALLLAIAICLTRIRLKSRRTDDS